MIIMNETMKMVFKNVADGHTPIVNEDNQVCRVVKKEDGYYLEVINLLNGNVLGSYYHESVGVIKKEGIRDTYLLVNLNKSVNDVIYYFNIDPKHGNRYVINDKGYFCLD